MRKYRIKSMSGIQGGTYYRPQVKFKYIPFWMRCNFTDFFDLKYAKEYIELIKKEY